MALGQQSHSNRLCSPYRSAAAKLELECDRSGLGEGHGVLMIIFRSWLQVGQCHDIH